ncbi:MAG: hypothetical protein ACOY45_04375 [Pseudomonadota bacterium]
MTLLPRFVIGAALALAPLSAAHAQSTPAWTPAQAISAAAASSGGEVEGTVEFQVVSTGASGFSYFLNSEADYRSPANLSVEIQASAANALRARYNAEPSDALDGKRVRVRGIVHRVPIPRRDPKPGEPDHYYQTRVDVQSADQITILD